MKNIFFCTAFLFCVLVGNSQPRQRLLFDFNWRFHLGDAPDVDKSLNYVEVADLQKTQPEQVLQELKWEKTRQNPVESHVGERLSFVQASFNDRKWGRVNLPHDWAVELPYRKIGPVHKGMKDIDSLKGTNIGWYRKSFSIPKSDKGKIINFEFDGIYRNALFWINGHCIGRNVSGYIGNSYDITKYINYGGKNIIVIRVDASHDEGWFYEGAGIYRHVWLVKTEPLYVGHWGTFVHSTLDTNFAMVTVETTIENKNLTSANFDLKSVLLDSDGKEVGEVISENRRILQGEETKIIQHIKLMNPHLWDLENPYLYHVKSTIFEKGKIIDVYETPHGIRSIHFDKDKGFFLNGKHVYIKGTCNHQDYAGVGVAMPDGLQYYRIEKLKEMGSNAYRSAHNQPTPELLTACDQLGMLVMDEARRMSIDKEAVSQLERMVKRDRNHPSIFIWSIGNEEEKIQGDDKYGIETAKRLQDLVHQLDSTRLVTVAMNGKWGEGFSKVIDVQGFNYLRNGDMDIFRNKFPNTPAIGTEEGSTHATRGVYESDEAKGHVSSYLPVLRNWSVNPETWLQYYSKRPWISGGFVWTGFDYRGEPVYRNWPNVLSSYGIMDICGFPKDHFYDYQAAWSTKTVLHILPHWTLPDSLGKIVKVWIYSNCDEVELFLNDVSIGRKKTTPLDHLEWEVIYSPGKLSAKGYNKGVFVIEDKVETTTEPVTVKVYANKGNINADGQDISIINLSIVDAKGRVVPEADNELSYEITGPGKIIGIGNGNPISNEPDKGNKRKVFMGLGQLIIQSTKKSGIIRIKVMGKNLKSVGININSVQTVLQPQL